MDCGSDAGSCTVLSLEDKGSERTNRKPSTSPTRASFSIFKKLSCCWVFSPHLRGLPKALNSKSQNQDLNSRPCAPSFKLLKKGQGVMHALSELHGVAEKTLQLLKTQLILNLNKVNLISKRGFKWEQDQRRESGLSWWRSA